MRKIRMNTIAKAALMTFPSQKYNKLEREIAVKTRLLEFAIKMQKVEVEFVMELEADDGEVD